MNIKVKYVKCFAAFAIIAAVLGVVAATVFTNDETQKRVTQTAAGSELYAQNCASCHGANLEGEPNWQDRNTDGSLPAPPHNEDGHTWHHTDQLLFDYTKLGGSATLALSGVTGFNSGMPAFEDALSDAEILSILAYIKSTWSERARIAQQERSKADE